MRTLPSGMQDDLDSGATTHCFCWLLTRQDGTELGFTDHDKDLVFDDVTFEPDAGLVGSATEQRTGLNVDNLNVVGAMQSARITDDDISAGKYDFAEVKLYRVDWTNVTKRFILLSGHIGEVTRGRVTFEAEIRSISAILQQRSGRLYQSFCDANLGDSRCGVDLDSDSSYKVVGSVTSSTARNIFTTTTSAIVAIESDWFARGTVTWTSGNNNGTVMEIKRHTLQDGVATIELWEPLPKTIQASDGFRLQVGCDKTIDTCNGKFSNQANFRGFPRMPTNDMLMAGVGNSSEHTGGSYYATGVTTDPAALPEV